ncbi:MAG: putative signal transduction protein with Nacht domain [Edaphobacter sp.]|nr:putative signal transduction protein with Nacht domain [Edaphobacter sp.]
MELISLGISLSAAAHHVLSQVDWTKTGSDYAKKGAETSGKALWNRLKPSEKDKAAKLAVGLFIEQFLSELEDKTPLASALPGYQDHLKKLTESAFYEISHWMQPEVEEVDLEPVRRLWGSLGLDELPQGFDWDLVAKNFARSVRKSIKADNGLREGLMVALQEQIAESSAKSAQAVERMAGPLVGFDLVGYRNFLLNTSAGLQLALLHPSTYAYDRQVSLWSVFVPQSARISAPSSLLMSADVGTTSDEQTLSGHDGSSEPSGEAFDESNVLSILEIADRERLLVILGDPGSGKDILP